MEELYQEHIIELSLRPQNYGNSGGSLVFVASNPVCGDNLSIYVTILGDKISNMSFTGECCALSTASASLLTGWAIGKSLHEIQTLLPAEVYNLLGVPISPPRVGCVLLPYTALQNISKSE